MVEEYYAGPVKVINLIKLAKDRSIDDFRQQYARHVPACIAKFGGWYDDRGGVEEVLHGVPPDLFVSVWFESSAAAHAWQESEEYKALREIRETYLAWEIVFIVRVYDGEQNLRLRK